MDRLPGRLLRTAAQVISQLHSSFTNYLEEHTFLTITQSGLRSLYSTVASPLCIDINRLSLYVHIYDFLLLGTHQSVAKMVHVRIHINNESLKHVSVAKYLDMYKGSNLKWDDHIIDMIPKISAKIGILRSLRKIVPIDTLKHLYNAIVQHHFD